MSTAPDDEFQDLRSMLVKCGVTEHDVARALAAKRAEVVSSRRRKRWMTGLTAAACIAVALAVTPALLQPESSAAIALGPTNPLTFPVTPTVLPPRLAGPSFERDGDLQIARYTGPDGAVLTIAVGPKKHWDMPQGSSVTEVNGTPAYAYEANGTPHVVWEHDGQWVGVSGRGAFAKQAALMSVAEGLSSEDQSVQLPLAVSPIGWQPTNYKSDRTMTLTDASGRTLVLTLTGEETPPDPDAFGLQDSEVVDNSPQHLVLGRQGDGTWILLGTTPSGTWFALQAHEDLTREQVIDVGEGVQDVESLPPAS